jgi:uncharacterized protein with von Willebrand factor type A (vWA) domain
MLADNVVHFARVLRHAGLAVGPDRLLAALEAIETVGLARRDDVHAALSAVMIDRHEQQALFDDAFAAFWRDPKLLERMMAELLPKITGRGDRANKPRSNRLADALAPKPLADAATPARQPDDTIEFETSFAFSDRERLQRADFESMTAAEFELAKKLAEEVPLPFAPVRRRRPRSERARPDRPARDDARDGAPARDARAALQPGAERAADDRRPARRLGVDGPLRTPDAALRARPDAALPQGPHAHLRHAPHQHHARAAPSRPDLALELASAQVQDWKGGTRIASCLDDFNRHWARRLLGANAALLLVTDGLDRDEHGELTRAAEQLRLFARQIVWLNPLLRFDRSSPRPAACARCCPYVDRFLPVHNLRSLADLATALRSAPAARR